MNELISVGILLTATVGGLLAFAPRLSEWLVTLSARRLPSTLSERMREEWLAELGALPGRVSQLAFAIALTLTRRHSFAIDEESPFAPPARPPITLATFGGWPSVVVFTTVVVAAIAYAASFLIQPLYRSHSRFALLPAQIPARFVEPAPRTPLGERLRALSATALSRGNLERVILEFELYKSDRVGRTGSDVVIERMRRDISLDVFADGQTFQIAYASSHPRKAMQVTNRLMELLIKENHRDRDASGRSAVTFLNTQIKDVRSRLLQTTAHPGEPPSSPSDADVRALEHENLKTTYRDLLLKKEQVLLSAEVENGQIGERFFVLEGARLPEAPISPNRTRLTLLGAIVGFCLSVAMMVAGRGGPSERPRKVLAQS